MCVVCLLEVSFFICLTSFPVPGDIIVFDSHVLLCIASVFTFCVNLSLTGVVAAVGCKPTPPMRLVLDTAFENVGRYSKLQPSLMPDIDSTLRTVGQWKFLIVTHLTSAFYQISLSRPSMKYYGTITPYKGIRVYTRCAIGMPGSETALEELMCRVLRDHIQAGLVSK